MDLSQALEIASCTDPGMVRSHNEDSIASDAANGLVVLADGMGGYNAGEVASGMATTVITTEMQQLLDQGAALRDRPGDQASRSPRACCASRCSRRTPRSTRRRRASRSTRAWAPRWWSCLFYDNKMTVGAHRRLAPVPHARRASSSR